MNKKLLCSTLLLMCVGMTGCIGLISVPSRGIAAIPTGTHEALSFQVDLPKRSHSWEIGLWPSTGGTNIGDLTGRHLVAKVTNASDRKLTFSPGVSSPFERVLIVLPGQTVVVCDAPMKSLAQVTCLFGCDAHEHAVSFQLNFEFHPPVRIHERMTVRARGRDAL
jgi:hypothetical protein